MKLRKHEPYPMSFAVDTEQWLNVWTDHVYSVRSDLLRSPRVKGAIEDAKKQMSIIEVAISLVGMYGMNLVANGGKQKVTRVVKRDANGALEETEITEYHKPSETLSTVVDAG